MSDNPASIAYPLSDAKVSIRESEKCNVFRLDGVFAGCAGRVGVARIAQNDENSCPVKTGNWRGPLNEEFKKIRTARTAKSILTRRELSMIRAFRCTAMLVVLSAFWASWASAGELSADYLSGRWVIDEKSCSSSRSEYMEFSKNGTFVNTRTGKAEIVGFWELAEGMVILHMVTSPAFFDDIHDDLRDFEGSYHYFQANLAIFNIQDKGFEAVGMIGSQVKRAKAVKCP